MSHSVPRSALTPWRRMIPAALALTLVLGSGACRREAKSRGNGRRPTRPAATRQLTLVSYNVLADPRHAVARIPALLAILEATEADIIALQEVAPWFLRILAAQPWVRRYQRTPVGPGRGAPGRLGRSALLADLRVDNTTLAVATCHLESPLADGKIRAQQLAVIFPLLQHAPDAVLLGDLNFGDKAQPESKQLPKTYKDLWTALRKDAPGYTWDNDRSAMARLAALPGEYSRRLDRILWRSATWRPHTVRIIGTHPVAPDTPSILPSDHFGLLGVLQR
jgi:endonuclease/exonuclease/phosphatase family metal-dependent hydrolase